MSAVDQTTCVGEVVDFDRNLSHDDGVVSVNLNINPVSNSNGDDVRIGSFIGHKGGRIKTLTGKSKSRYLKEFTEDEIGGFRLQVKTQDDTIVANWNDVEGVSNVERFNEIVLEEISMCEGIVNGTIQHVRNNKSKPKENKKPKKSTSNRVFYTFWVPIHSRFFGKMIGVEGSVISMLKHDIQTVLELDRTPAIRLNESGRPLNDQFHLKMDNSEYHSGSDNNGIWITVNYTGKKGFKFVADECQKFIDSNFNDQDDVSADDSQFNDVSDDDDEEDDPEDNGWGN